MRAALSILALLLLALTTVGATDLPVHFQHDGGQEGDASDACTKLNRFLEQGQRTQGMLMPALDTADHYGVYVHTPGVTTLVGEAGLLMEAAETAPRAPHSVVFRVYDPTCSHLLGEAPPVSFGYESVTFFAQERGLYVVQAALREGSADGTAGPAALGNPLQPGTNECHFACDQLGPGLAGYRLQLI
ncbi:MAG TPA: hypothetical protein VNZ52_15730 [Candidatus Thermoplasmatota archaeon]|nr:hypothetical protein [Candidatus Thermoplasmatota archaeon]